MPVLLSSWNPAPQDAGFHEDNEKSVRITEIFPKTYLRMNIDDYLRGKHSIAWAAMKALPAKH